MISTSSYLWADRKGTCPVCLRPIKVDTQECPHCRHCLSKSERDAVKVEANSEFRRSATIGLIIFSLFILLMVFLF